MFVTQEVALQLIRSLPEVIAQIARWDGALADQLRRASSSVLLNIAEGNRRAGRDRQHLFRVAAGSAAEVGAVLEVACAWGYVEDRALHEVRVVLDRELGLLHGLTHTRS